MSMKSTIQFFLIAAVFTITILFNIGLVDIRFKEINYLLGKAAFDHNVSKAFGIVAKYELIKRRISHGEDNTENYELEARIQALTSGEQFIDNSPTDVFKKSYAVPVRFILNGIRFILGKKLIHPKEDDKIYNVLEIGYLWERTRKYPEAIEIYDDVLEKSFLDQSLQSAVLMHKAFCHSMMSEYGKAKEIFEQIITLYPHTDAGMLSWKLLDFLTMIEKKREKVAATILNDFDRAKNYYLLMDYRNAIKHYSLFIQNNTSHHNISEARYFKARAHEEIGESEEAIIDYRQVIRNDRTKQWAREAHRRMLMLGEFYEYKKQMAQEARRQLETYHDNIFIQKVSTYKKMVSTGSIKDELLKKTGTGTRISDNPDIAALINNVGELEIMEHTPDQKSIDSYHQELIDNGIKTHDEVRELKRKQILAENPFRRPSALKEIIDRNSVQLQYLYNRQLRKGNKLFGKMIVEMIIDAEGTIKDAHILHSNMGDTHFEKEVIAKIESWKFHPVAESLGILTIRYPFEFYQE